MDEQPKTSGPLSASETTPISRAIQPPSDHSIEPTASQNAESVDLARLPELPPDKFDSYPQIISKAPLQSDPSNQKLIQFLFSLSNLVLFGGSLAGVIVFIYQKYLFPKLKIRTNILRLLRLSSLKSYEKLLGNLHDLVQSNSNLYSSSSSKISLNNAIKINSSDLGDDQEVKKSDFHLNQNVKQAPTESIADTHLADEKDNTKPPAQTLNLAVDQTPKINDSSSTSSTSDNEAQAESNVVKNSNEGKFNAPIIQQLEQIAKRLRKREENQKEDTESIQSEDIINSKNPTSMTTTTETKINSRAVKKLKESIKSIDEEISQQARQTLMANRRFCSSSHIYPSYGFNQWSTYSPGQSNDQDPYFVALDQFKSLIRELKGNLLNRRKFY